VGSSKAAEAVRLVVWDLDETLWRGTLDDLGVIEHVSVHYEIIRELNRRGIMNSVCSKNDFDTARKVLEDAGVWNEIVFPSIDWTAKGPRLKELVASMQLRPESVLFIDDNESNLAEARALVPGIQVALPEVIEGLLEDPRFQSDMDSGLVRLAHYKLLKKRQEAKMASNGDNLAFLRASEIKIILDFDIETNIDRAIELINRTNQLNFTKVRLPETLILARKELRALVSKFNVKAALIRVKDAYGDHGYCGLYILEGSENSATLLHFCFSCRIIGMGVEQKVYEYIGRPTLVVAGETVSDLNSPSQVDWIDIMEAVEGEGKANVPMLGEVRLRGGCDLSSIGHYFNLHTQSLVYETNYVRKHLFFMRDCTTNLLHSLRDSVSSDVLSDFGIEPWEYETRLFDPISSDGLIIISMWGDVVAPHYRRKGDDRIIVNNLRHMSENGVAISDEEVERKFAHGHFDPKYKGEALKYLARLKSDFYYNGKLSSEEIKSNSNEMLKRIPKNVPTFVLLPSRYWVDESGTIVKYIPSIAYSVALKAVAAQFPSVNLVDVDDFIKGPEERYQGWHFNRIVYYRVFRHIIRQVSAISSRESGVIDQRL